MIEFSHVDLTYDEASRPALRDVNLRIDDGESVAVVGPSGSGKTSLLKLIDALVLPTSGRVVVDGFDTREASHLWDVRRLVGFVFQNPDNQLVSTTVERELAFGMENLGIPRDEMRRRIEEVVRALDLGTLLDRSPHRLSGGEKQRVAIAAVLAMRPSHVALDEPTSLLDGRGRREVWEILRGISHDRSRTVVHVTQFPEEIALAERAVVLVAGRVVFDGPPGELFSRTDDLARWGLRRPCVMELADQLRMAGLPVPEGSGTLDALVDALGAAGDGGMA